MFALIEESEIFSVLVFSWNNSEISFFHLNSYLWHIPLTYKTSHSSEEMRHILETKSGLDYDKIIRLTQSQVRKKAFMHLLKYLITFQIR